MADEKKDVDLDTLSDEELANLEKEPPKVEETPEAKAAREATEKAEADKKAAEDAAKKGDEELTEEEKAAKAEADKKAAEEKAKEEARKKRGIEEFNKREAKRDELRKRNRELEIENLKLKAGAFKPLDDDELKELREVDPDAYIEYREKEREAKVANEQIEKVQKTHVTEDQAEVGRRFIMTVFEFAAAEAGVELTEIPDDARQLPEAVRKYMASEEYNTIAQNVDEIFGDQIKAGIFPNLRQIQLVADSLKKGKLTAEAAEKLKQNIDKAKENTSPLNKQHDDKTKGLRDYSKVTQAEIDAMSETELVEYEKFIRERGIGQKGK
jgi:hypothetical protein